MNDSPETLRQCPQCRFKTEATNPECPNCGLIFSKWENRASRNINTVPPEPKPLLSSSSIKTFPVRWIGWGIFLVAIVYIGFHIKPKAVVYRMGIAAGDGAFTLTEFVKFIGEDDTEAVKTYIQAGMSPNTILASGEPAYFLALGSNHGEMTISALLNGGADLNLQDSTTGDTALMTALQRRPAEKLKWIIPQLIQRGAKVNTANNQGRTPLMEAVRQANYRPAGPTEDQKWLVQYLVQQGADVNAKDNLGQMAGDKYMGYNNAQQTNPFNLPESIVRTAPVPPSRAYNRIPHQPKEMVPISDEPQNEPEPEEPTSYQDSNETGP